MSSSIEARSQSVSPAPEGPELLLPSVANGVSVPPRHGIGAWSWLPARGVATHGEVLPHCASSRLLRQVCVELDRATADAASTQLAEPRAMSTRQQGRQQGQLVENETFVRYLPVVMMPILLGILCIVCVYLAAPLQ